MRSAAALAPAIVGRVVYATINIQSSCNNLCDDCPDPIEYAARNAAGDSHYFRNWLKVNVDPTSLEVFSYEPQIVNRDLLVP